MRYALVILILAVAALAAAHVRNSEGAATTPPVARELYQGKPIKWWADRTVIARREANASRQRVASLVRTLRHSPSVAESVKLAAITYPAFSEARAWCIIRHESGGNPYAKNRSSTASGLYQFLTSTFASTPYGRAGMSIWSPYAQSLAAGYMHSVGRGREWAINC